MRRDDDTSRDFANTWVGWNLRQRRRPDNVRGVRVSRSAGLIVDHEAQEQSSPYHGDSMRASLVPTVRNQPGPQSRIATGMHLHSLYVIAKWHGNFEEQPSTGKGIHQRCDSYCCETGEGVRYRVGQNDLVVVAHGAASIDDIGNVTLTFARIGTDKRFT